MIDKQDLEKAVRSGEVSRQQLEDLLALASESRPREASARDPEKFGFLKGFNDVFLALGVVLVLGSIATAFGKTAGGWATVAIAAASWAMAEVLSRQTRAVLPMIAAAVGVLVPAVYLAYATDVTPAWSPEARLLLGSIVALLLAAAFYLYFRLPFSLALIAGAATLALVMAAKLVAGAPVPNLTRIIQLVCGLCAFAAAMRFDMKDPLRQTDDADKAFWLHIAAAPLIVNAIAQPLMDNNDVSVFASAAVIVIVAVVAVVAMIIDRRALLVSSLTYFIVALTYLMKGTNEGNSVAIPFGVAGLLVLVLGIFWHQLRAVLFRYLPETLPLSKLPPPRP